ncbi:MAG TPA: ABC transporter permease subunit, partial [Rhodothermales bacterium]
MLTRRTAIVLGVAVLAILIGYVLYPSVELFAAGLRPSVYRRLFASWHNANVRALWNSVWISLATVAGAGILGSALAYALNRFDFPGKRVMNALAALPLALPPLVGVIAFLFLYGESGVLPRGLQRALGLDEAPLAFEGFAAIWLVHVYSMYVYFYLFVGTALAGVDRSMYEAANDLGASGGRTFRDVILPLLQPALLGAGLLVFMVSMASFTAPLIFAGTEPFLTLQVYNYKMNGDMAMSAGASTVLTLICLLFLVFIERSGRSTVGAASKGIAAAAMPVRRGAVRWGVMLACAVFALFLLLPIATIVLVSFAEEGSWTYQILPQRYTVDNYLALFRDPNVLAPIVNSLTMAGIATAANVLFGVGAALYIVKTRLPGRVLARALAVLPFAIPGTVVAVNLIVTFNSATLPGFGKVLVGSFWILPLAYFIR